MKNLIIFAAVIFSLEVTCQDYSRVPLGMTNGFIKNDQITATSQYSADYFPYTARLKLTGIRYCSKQPLNYNDYVQVDFKSVVTLTGVATQGDDSYSSNYVKKYYLQVSLDGSTYSDVSRVGGIREEYTGNINNNDIVYNWLSVPTKARFARFRASDVSGTHICVRLEYYGNIDSKAADKSLYSLGMESKVIKNSQLSHSSEFNSNPSRNGRLNLANSAWCVNNGNNNEWMQIDFEQPMVVSAISTQGHGGSISKDRTYKYYLQYRQVGSATFTYAKNLTNGNMLFTGNYRFQNLIVMNVLPVPVQTQFLRINPITYGYQSSVKCLRAEVYGYHPECADDLTRLDSVKLNVSSSKSGTYVNGSRIHSRYAWCANTAATTEYIQVDLGAIKRITGFGIQGDTENDQWPTKVKFGISNDTSSTPELATEYIGSIGRFEVTRHWLKKHIYGRFIRIRPTEVNGGGSVCMRIQVLGCKKALDYSRVPLGMSNGFIKNDQITATSQFSADYFPYTARLKLTGIRWCSVLKSGAPVNYSEYVQVDFKSVVTLTGVATQGDDGHGPNYVKKYYLQVSLDGSEYNDVLNNIGARQIFTGNTDNTGIVYDWLSVPTNARFVRFRASDISGNHICVRLEFYGSIDSKAADKSLYALGMESKVIKNSQLSHSSEFNSNPSRNGRLNLANSAWCPNNGNNNEWMQIDFEQPMVVSASSTQGHGGSVSKDRTYKYYLQYRQVGSATFTYAKNLTNGNMLFTGNYKFQNLIVMNVLPVPVQTQYLRINPITDGYQSSVRCLRAEIYGYHPVCYDDVTNHDTINATSSANAAKMATVYSKTTWCASASDSTKYIEVDLGMRKMVTGVGVQGDSDNDYWVKTFKLSHGITKDNMQDLAQTYTANGDRNSVVRNWLLPPIFTRFIRIKVDTFQTTACMRIQVLGCSSDHAVLRSISSRIINMRKVEVSWDVVYNASNTFTLQYRKESESKWSEIQNLQNGSVSLPNLEKYQNYIVRLKSVKGILMLKNYVFGGTFSETSKFKLEIEPGIKPRSSILVNTTMDTITIYWQQLTQNEILDWDIQGINIIYNCINELNGEICDGTTFKEANVTDLAVNKFNATGLKDFTNYIFNLKVYNTVGKGPNLTITFKTKTGELKFAPKIQSLKRKTTSLEYIIKENKTVQVDGYRVAYRCIQTVTTRDCQSTKWINISTVSNSILINGLSSWTKYEIRIKGYNKVGESPENVTSATTLETAPAASPSISTSNALNSTAIQISWQNLKKNDTNGQLIKFTVKLRRIDTSKEIITNVSSSLLGATINGLKPYANYSIEVAALNQAGYGPYSQAVVVETMQAAPVASPAIQAIKPETRSAKITIKNIEKEDENGPLNGYKIRYQCIETAVTRRCPDKTWNTVTVSGGGKTELELGNLRSWTRHSVEVNVFNKIGDGPFSGVSNLTTLEKAPSKSPKNVTIQVTGPRTFRLDWLNLDWNDRNGIITLFSIKIKNKTGLVKAVNISSTSIFYNVANLLPYSNYSATVAAINNAGIGPYSNYVMAQTSEEAPGAVSTITAIKTQKFSFSLTTKNINKELEHGKIIGYIVFYECVPNGDSSRDCPVNSKKNETILGYPFGQLTVSKLTSWTKYKVSLQIFNSAGRSGRSGEMEGITKEDNPSNAPSNIKVEVKSSKSVDVSWAQLVKDDTNGPITGYKINLRYLRRGISRNKSLETSDLSLTINNLFPYTVYNISVIAKNSAGHGPESGVKSKRTEEDAPSAPYDIKAVPQSSTSVKLSWKEPLDPNGIIRKYTLEYCNKKCTNKTLPGNVTETVLTGLETNVNYTFKVIAYTIKVGNWSDVVIEKTIEGIPSEPLKLRIVNRGMTFLNLAWNEPALPRGHIRYYQIKGNGSKPYNATFKQTINIRYQCNPFCKTSHALNNLIPGTFYNLKIAAATVIGQGPYSKILNGWTRIAAAPTPRFDVVSKFIDRGTERNITVNTVTNYYGPIDRYQVIVQTRTDTEPALKAFPQLNSKSDAAKKGLSYYLATEWQPNAMPLLIQIKPGIAMVNALKTELETPGKYYLHFRAISLRQGETVNGNASVFNLERELLEPPPDPDPTGVSAFTIKISLKITLPTGFTPSYYYIIAVKITETMIIQDVSNYKQKDLKQYDPNVKDTPYIAAVLTPKEFASMTEFDLGNGKVTKTLTVRRKRLARATAEEYNNQPLDPDSTYSAFIRVVSSTSSAYSTPWTKPVKTKSAPPKKEEREGGQVGAISAGVGVAIAIIVAAVVAFVYMKRRRGKGDHESREQLDAIDQQELKDFPDGDDSPPRKSRYEDICIQAEPTSLKVNKSSVYPPLSAKDIVQVFNRKSASDDAGFCEEFETLPKEQLFTWQTGGDPDNKPRNRFANIMPYDYNRVKLRQAKDGSDYVNASYIVDYFGQRRYIACQAPVPKTVSDFWVMIWEQKIGTIVMLTRCVEGTKTKSEQYWPLSGTEAYDDIEVSFHGAEEYPDYVFSTLEVRKGNTTRTVRHLHFIAWPDYGVPEYPTSLLSFRRRLRGFLSWEKQGDELIAVHCSAGVGRTGTFIAIDSLITLIQKSRIIDVYGYAQLLRIQRSQMVQRSPQYKFIYECLLEAAVCGITEISVQEFRQRYNNLRNVDPKTKKDGFYREFTSLSFVAIEIPDDDFTSGKMAVNQAKNRDPNVLPRNTLRVFLPSLTPEEGCNYINATYVDGNTKDQFIATQSPLENTVKDFWRVVIERESSTIVSLTEVNEVYPRYYPNVSEALYDGGKISVEITETEEIAKGLIRSKLTAKDKSFNRSLNEIHHYHFNSWSDHSVPDNITELVTMIEAVETTQRRISGGPIIVHCGNGTGRTGTFMAAFTILERLKSQQMVDIFQTVRRMRKVRPTFVENTEQYRLLYEVVVCYLEQFSTYSNF